MGDSRQCLNIGTRLTLEQGAVYEISGDPIGWGGGSILYPATRLIENNGQLDSDGFQYALKECYPVSTGRVFVRNDRGEVVPQSGREEDEQYLLRARQLQQAESATTQAVYRTASRMLPIREVSQKVSLTLPDGKTATVCNTVTVMDSLSGKGRSLRACLTERRSQSVVETFRIAQQLLFSLQEVHQAGYLHLDIQDGNVFLRGTLEEQNELVTLIDFGSARPMDNGKTAPIRDRMIFTTPGFSAPEILLHNDGTLQLGPEADLYSVGCLMLYLLTGQKPDSRHLLANRTGIFLKPNQIRRLQCPQHLVGRVQRFLGRALQKDPKDRFHSVGEMLSEVSELVQALQPYRTDLDAIQYDAFICYKHGPVDNEAALTLQRALENYRAPKGIAESRKPFHRVFVDEGELSSCADFGQQIREALKNAGWLIVLCSEKTPTSPWVQLEIDTFLQYHDRSRILAVLTGGDEKTSFPPQLKGSGTGTDEILAADARGADLAETLQKLKKDALLKVAAPMLHTTFDMLKQRQKLYRMQQIAAAAAGCLAVTSIFAVYAMDRAAVIARQAEQIQREYETALINESRFLTEQAEKRLDSGDPLAAMELLLQALPNGMRDRPVLPETEYMLGKALGIYTPPSAATFIASAEGIIETEFSHFMTDQRGNRLLLWDDSGYGAAVQAWSIDRLCCLWEYHTEASLYDDPILLGEDRVLLPSFYDLICLNRSNGLELWRVSREDAFYAAVSGDGKEVILFSGDQGDYFNFYEKDTEPRAITVSMLSSDTGEVRSTITFPMDPDQYVTGMVCVSPDLKWAAVVTVDEGYDDYIYHEWNSVYLVDLTTGECTLLLDSQTQIMDMEFVYGQLALIRSSGYSWLTTENNVEYSFMNTIETTLECYSPDSAEQLWGHNYHNYLRADSIDAVAAVSYDMGSGEEEGVLFTFLDQCVLVDASKGEVVREYGLHASALNIRYNANSFESINADGTYSGAGYGNENSVTIPYFPGDVSAVCRVDDTFFIQRADNFDADNTIYKYRLGQSDASYTGLYEAPGQDWQLLNGKTIALDGKIVLAKDESVLCADRATGEVWQHERPGFSVYDVEGVSADERWLYWYDYDMESDSQNWIRSGTYFRMDLVTGAVTEVLQPKSPSDYTHVYDHLLLDETLYFTAYLFGDMKDSLVVYAWDLRNNTLAELYANREVPTQWRFLYDSLVLSADGTRLYTAIGEEKPERLLCVDLQTGSVSEVAVAYPEGETDTTDTAFCWNRDRSVAVVYFEHEVRAVEMDGTVRWRISTEHEVISMALSPDESSLLLYAEDNTVSRHSIANGEFQASVNLADYGSVYAYAGIVDWQIMEENTLLVIPERSDGFVLDTSADALAVRTRVADCVGYDAHADAFLIYESSSYTGQGSTVGCFRRYGIEELIGMAGDILRG